MESARTARDAPWLTPLCAAILAAGVAFAFGGAHANGFVLFDDRGYLTGNAALSRGLDAESVRWAFTTYRESNWHPLTWLSHLVDVELFGFDAGAHHVVSVALHALSSVLLFTLLLRWTGARWLAFAAAAFFAWHPLRTESVVWASERKDVLAVLFGILALHAWTSWVRDRRARDAWFAHLAFAASLLAKPTLVTFPFLVLVLDVWPFARTASRVEEGGEPAPTFAARVREKLGLFVLAFASCVVTFRAQSAGGAVVSSAELGFAARAANALESVLTYAVQLVWPADLSVYYPYPRTIDLAGLAAAGAFVAAVLVCAWRTRRSAPAIATGAAWFAGSLVPMLGLVQVGGQAHADRYTYWPSIGFAIALVFGLAQLGESRATRAAVRGSAALAACGLVLLACSARAQTALWRDTRTLFEHARAVVPESALVRLNLGNEAYEARDLARALEHYSACVALDPAYPEALNGLGTVYLATGRHDEARASFQRAIELGRDNANVRSNLGVLAQRTRAFADARAEFERALAFDETHLVAQRSLGLLLQSLGDHAGAYAHLARARTLEPGDVETERAFANSAFLLERYADAIDASARVLVSEPDDFESLARLAWLRAMAPDPALRDARAALALAERALRNTRADSARAHDVLSAARAENGDFAGALAAATRAVELYRATDRARAAAEVEKRVEAYRAGRAAH